MLNRFHDLLNANNVCEDEIDDWVDCWAGCANILVQNEKKVGPSVVTVV
jgi:hypothetical protein